MMETQGWYWHVHHDMLMEWCYDYDERVAYIRKEKPADEVELRLRLFRPVRGELPKRLVEACAALVQAYAALDQTYPALVQAKAAWVQVYPALVQAKVAWDQVYVECLPEIEALHAVECPDCPWRNGSIFGGSK